MTSDGEFAWRPIEPADAGNWSALMTAIQFADCGWEFLSEQDLLEEFDDPDCDFARGFTVDHTSVTQSKPLLP
jgi:hypothetical protein